MLHNECQNCKIVEKTADEAIKQMHDQMTHLIKKYDMAEKNVTNLIEIVNRLIKKVKVFEISNEEDDE